MNVRDASILPDRIQLDWTVGDGRLGWIAAPGLRCASGPQAHEEAAAADTAYASDLQLASPVIYLAGDAPGGMWRDWLGAYELRVGPLINGRHVYVQRGSEGRRMLWYTDGVFWRFGPGEDVGKQRGEISRARPHTTTPSLTEAFARRPAARIRRCAAARKRGRSVGSG